MCVNYCPSFPALFHAIDDKHERLGLPHDATTVDDQDVRKVVDLCWQCKICYVKCPYTPDDGHEWKLDFPRVLWREKMVRARREGLSVQDQVLGEPGLMGKLNSGAIAPLTNFIAKHALVRRAGELVAGLSARFPVPLYAQEPFDTWFSKYTPSANAGTHGEVALFSTCLVDYHRPAIGRAAVKVLDHAGIACVRPKQVCCGMPNLDTGDLDAFREKAAFNVAQLAEQVRAGRTILAPGPSCSMTLRKEYPRLLKTADAQLVAEHTMDLMEYLWRVAWQKKKALPREFASALGAVAYHAPCHLRAQKIAAPAQLLLQKIRDTQVTMIEQCSAVDGTWGLKAENYDLGVQYSKRLTEAVSDAEPDHVATDCPMAGQRISHETGKSVVHPVELLARAYGLAV
jgi:glycerol-3-phosphate dehydrogenase subunit C